MAKPDVRLQHKCKWHLPEQTDEMMQRVKPFPGAPYYRYQFVVECPRCHSRLVVTCSTVGKREEEMRKYPKLVRFPK